MKWFPEKIFSIHEIRKSVNSLIHNHSTLIQTEQIKVIQVNKSIWYFKSQQISINPIYWTVSLRMCIHQICMLYWYKAIKKHFSSQKFEYGLKPRLNPPARLCKKWDAACIGLASQGWEWWSVWPEKVDISIVKVSSPVSKSRRVVGKLKKRVMGQ
jgi:hypothetical protein